MSYFKFGLLSLLFDQVLRGWLTIRADIIHYTNQKYVKIEICQNIKLDKQVHFYEYE